MKKKVKYIHKIKSVKKDNLYLPKSFSKFTSNRFFKQFIDERNFGINKRFRFTKNYINKCLQIRSYHKDKINLKMEKHIEAHLFNNETYFYTSNPFSDFGMLAIDLDTTETSTKEDMIEAAEYIVNNFHQGAYYETSTSGKGIHIYILISLFNLVI